MPHEDEYSCTVRINVWYTSIPKSDYCHILFVAVEHFHIDNFSPLMVGRVCWLCTPVDECSHAIHMNAWYMNIPNQDTATFFLNSSEDEFLGTLISNASSWLTTKNLITFCIFLLFLRLPPYDSQITGLLLQYI